MNKLYYITNLDNWGTGIKNKIDTQINIFKINGFSVEYIVLKKNIRNNIVKFLNRIIPFFSNNDYNKLKSIENNSVVYIRHFNFDYKFLSFLKKLRLSASYIILEIPTYPYDWEKKGILKLFLYKDRICRKFIHKYIDYIVTYSDDDQIYGIKTINISNFVNSYSKFNKKLVYDYKKINIIAVASLAFWHGYDRMIEGLYQYYQNNNSKVEVYFHLVGDGRILKKLRQLVKKYRLSKYVIIYGNKSGEELEQIYNKCNLAVDSLGRHRSKVYYNSSLKGKEYLAKGLPIISGVRTELDGLNLPFYMRVPADDSPINIDDIITFYNSLLNQGIDQICEKEILYAKNNFNPYKCMEPILKIITNN